MITKTHIGTSDICGLWHRTWRNTPGTQDDSTHALRMQSEKLRVDVQLPVNVSHLASAGSMADLNDEQLRLLATAEGSAGTTSMRESVCTWKRQISFQGPLKSLDSGTLSYLPEGLLESGLYSSYEELWQPLDDTVPRGRTMTGVNGQVLVILWTNTCFAMGRGWPDRVAHCRGLREHVDYAIGRQDTAALARAFDQEFCFGRIEGGAGIIDCSTQPMRQGFTVFDADALSAKDPVLEIAVVDFYGKTSQLSAHATGLRRIRQTDSP